MLLAVGKKARFSLKLTTRGALIEFQTVGDLCCKGWREEIEPIIGNIPDGVGIYLYCRQTQKLSTWRKGIMDSAIYWDVPITKNTTIHWAEGELFRAKEGAMIVDIFAERQIAVNTECGRWKNLTPERFREAASWSRDTYLLPEDVDKIQKATQDLVTNCTSSFVDVTIRYGDATKKQVMLRDDQVIGRVTNRYWVIEGGIATNSQPLYLAINVPGSNIPLIGLN